MTTTMTKVKSSNIESIGYNTKKLELLVEFKGGKVFGYKYVSKDEYSALLNAESVGSHFSKFIKNTKVAKEVLVEKGTPKLLSESDALMTVTKEYTRMREAMVMIERIAMSPPIDRAILKIAKKALEVDS